LWNFTLAFFTNINVVNTVLLATLFISLNEIPWDNYEYCHENDVKETDRSFFQGTGTVLAHA
jgi:ribosome biogenesis protein Tsr3